jgi:hypothetical protein
MQPGDGDAQILPLNVGYGELVQDWHGMWPIVHHSGQLRHALNRVGLRGRFEEWVKNV